MNPTKRNYRATFIIDNRGKEESVEQIIEGVKQVITTVQGDVSSVKNLGRRDFVRVTDPKLTGATYVHISFSAPAERPGPALKSVSASITTSTAPSSSPSKRRPDRRAAPWPPSTKVFLHRKSDA